MISIYRKKKDAFPGFILFVTLAIKTGALFIFGSGAVLHTINQSGLDLQLDNIFAPAPQTQLDENVGSEGFWAFMNEPGQESHFTSGETYPPLLPDFLSLVEATPMMVELPTEIPTATATQQRTETSISTMIDTATPAPPETLPPTQTLTITPTKSITPTLKASSTYTATPTTPVLAAITATSTASVVPSQTASPTMAAILKPTLMEGDGAMCSPIDGIPLKELPSIISAPYSPPPPGSDLRHAGVDFAFYRLGGKKDILGVPVHAIMPGKIAGVIINRAPYGNAVIVETTNQDLPAELAQVLRITSDTSLFHLYAHMKDPTSWVIGQKVNCGDIIGLVGNSGTTMPHLHLESRRGLPGATFSSMANNDILVTAEEKKNYVYWRTSGVFQHFDPMDIFTAYQRYLINIKP